MTREERIEKESHNYSTDLILDRPLDYEDLEWAFQAGARFADANPDWHKYPEEKPKVNGEYTICTRDMEVYTDEYYINDDPKEALLERYSHSFSVDNNEIIAWMPKPKPPKF